MAETKWNCPFQSSALTGLFRLESEHHRKDLFEIKSEQYAKVGNRLWRYFRVIKVNDQPDWQELQ